MKHLTRAALWVVAIITIGIGADIALDYLRVPEPEPASTHGRDGFRKDLFRGVLPRASAQVTVAGDIGPGGRADNFTVAGTLDVTGDATFAGGLNVTNDTCLTIGTTVSSASPCIRYDTTQTVDAGMLLTGTVGNAWVIAERQDETFDFAHAQQTNPTLFIHSAAQSTTQWLSLTHNGTNGVITTGVGNTEIQGAIFSYDSYVSTDKVLSFGATAATSTSIGLNTTQTVDAAVLALGTTSRGLVIVENGDTAFDFAHAQATNPTLFIHSANQSTTEFMSLTHNQTVGVINSLGGISIPTTVTMTTPIVTSALLVNNDVALKLGSSQGATDLWIYGVRTSQTPDTAIFAVGSTSRSILMVDNATFANFDFAHAQQTNPTLFIHSATQSTTEWLGLTHNQTDGVLSVGAGGLVLPVSQKMGTLSKELTGNKALTAGAATTVTTVTLPDLTMAGIFVTYTVYSSESTTDFNARSGRLQIAMINDAGVESCGTITTVDQETEDGSLLAGANTLTYTWTCDTSGANAVALQLNAASGLTEDVLAITYTVKVNASAATVLLTAG